MFGQSPEAKIQAGRDKGLRPLLNFIARNLNLYIVQRLNPDFELQFLGVGAMSEKDEADLDKAMLEGPRTINEVRALKDLPSLGKEGDVLVNSSWLNYHTSQAGNQGGDGMGDFGGGEGDFGEGDFGEGQPTGPEPRPSYGADSDGGLEPPWGFDAVGKDIDSAVQKLLHIEIKL
jgi:hypothetical protein